MLDPTSARVTGCLGCNQKTSAVPPSTQGTVGVLCPVISHCKQWIDVDSEDQYVCPLWTKI